MPSGFRSMVHTPSTGKAGMIELSYVVFHQEKPGEQSLFLAALDRIASLDLPIASALKLRRIRRQIDLAATDMDAVRKDLVVKHGETGDGGQSYTVRRESYGVFNDQYKELLSQTFQVSEDFLLEDLGDLNQIRISAKVLENLAPFSIGKE